MIQVKRQLNCKNYPEVGLEMPGDCLYILSSTHLVGVQIHIAIRKPL